MMEDAVCYPKSKRCPLLCIARQRNRSRTGVAGQSDLAGFPSPQRCRFERVGNGRLLSRQRRGAGGSYRPLNGCHGSLHSVQIISLGIFDGLFGARWIDLAAAGGQSLGDITEVITPGVGRGIGRAELR